MLAPPPSTNVVRLSPQLRDVNRFDQLRILVEPSKQFGEVLVRHGGVPPVVGRLGVLKR